MEYVKTPVELLITAGAASLATVYVAYRRLEEERENASEMSTEKLKEKTGHSVINFPEKIKEKTVYEPELERRECEDFH